MVPAVTGDQHLGRPLHAALLEASDRAEPSAVAITLSRSPAGLDLNKVEMIAAPRHEVDLAVPDPKTLPENCVASPSQKARSHTFTEPP